jgi:hypothetical protein
MKMRGKRKYMMLCSMAVALLIILGAAGASADSIGEVTFLEGRVDILKPGQDIAIPIEAGAPVDLRDIIRTKDNARVEITLSDGTIIRLAEESRIELSAYTQKENENITDKVLTLTRGRARTLLSQGLSGLKVITPNAAADASGTDFYFIYEKGNSWFYGSAGSLLASSKNDPDSVLRVTPRSCVRFAPRRPFQNDCVFNDIDEQKYGWDTAATENVPVIAQLPTEGDVYTYTPLGGRAVETPSFPVLLSNDDLTCSQCPTVAIPLVQPASGGPGEVITKIGNFTRIDRTGSSKNPGVPF